jgi:hypothetical protein
MRSAGLNFRYDVVDVRDMDGEALVESEFISDNILAVLARTGDRAGAIRRIIGKIGRLEPGRREDAIRKLLILSGIRGLEKTVTEERNRMPVTFDIMDNEVLGPVIREGIRQGLEQGLAEGREQGLEQGQAEGSRRIMRVLLEKRFGMLPAWVNQRLASCTDSQTDDLALRLLDAKSLESLFCQPETY